MHVCLKNYKTYRNENFGVTEECLARISEEMQVNVIIKGCYGCVGRKSVLTLILAFN